MVKASEHISSIRNPIRSVEFVWPRVANNHRSGRMRTPRPAGLARSACPSVLVSIIALLLLLLGFVYNMLPWVTTVQLEAF